MKADSCRRPLHGFRGRWRFSDQASLDRNLRPSPRSIKGQKKARGRARHVVAPARRGCDWEAGGRGTRQDRRKPSARSGAFRLFDVPRMNLRPTGAGERCAQRSTATSKGRQGKGGSRDPLVSPARRRGRPRSRATRSSPRRSARRRYSRRFASRRGRVTRNWIRSRTSPESPSRLRCASNVDTRPDHTPPLSQAVTKTEGVGSTVLRIY